MPRSLKSPTTYEEQIDRLKSRGLIVVDETAAAKALQHLNYYRLSGYWYQFLKPNDKFRKGASFELVRSIHEFDMELRHLLMHELESLEIYFRTQLSYLFAHKHGEEGHYHSENFKTAKYHDAFLIDLSRAMEKNKDAPFVAHHFNVYGGMMPLWCAVEILSFTALSKFYNNLSNTDQREFARKMDYDAAYMSNWLHALSVLRNICAHYGRLYNRTMSPPISLGPKTLRSYRQIMQDSLFAYLVVILRCQATLDRKTVIISDLTKLLMKYNESIDISLLGFPSDWEQLLSDDILISR